ncbi:hypothetical protein HDU86_003596 [Geranomyces michiganensis]|nr:hypothetical protein HDU86_003596 [Geranomyces michiganensis]
MITYLLSSFTAAAADFASTVLRTPYPAAAYTAHSWLSASTKKHVLQGSDPLFDVAAFANAGHCTLTLTDKIHPHSQFTWDSGNTNDRRRRNSYVHLEEIRLAAASSASRLEDRLTEIPLTAWYEIDWNGAHLECVVLNLPRVADSDRDYYHVIADDRLLAEKFVATVERFCAEVKGAIWVFDNGDWVADKEMLKSIKASTFDSLILSPEIKSTIKEEIDLFFTSRDLYAEFDAPWKRGFLFSGPPGNGKTSLLKACVNHCLVAPRDNDVSILYVKSFKSCGSRPDEYNISQIFKRARNRPSLLLFEDLDSLVSDKNRSFFLNELDGMASNAGIMTIATTNHPNKLDPAIRDRPSRFDRHFSFPLPSEQERIAFLHAWCENRSTTADLQIPHTLAAEICHDSLTGGFSFAYLKELMLASIVRWMHSSSGSSKQLQQRRPFGHVLKEQAKILRKHIKKETAAEDGMAKWHTKNKAKKQAEAVAAAAEPQE